MKRFFAVVAVFLCLCAVTFAGCEERSYGPITVDYEGLVSQHDVVYLSPPIKGYEGPIIGNGEAGVRIWNPSDRIMMQANHSAFWDDTGNPPINVHGARIEIQAGLPLYDWKYLRDYKARMALYHAETVIDAEGSMGTSQMKAFYSKPHQVMVLEYHDFTMEPTSRKVLLERFGSQYFGNFGIREQNPELNLSGTTTGTSGNELWVEQELGTRKVVILLAIQSNLNMPQLNIVNKHQVQACWPLSRKCEFTLMLTMAHSEESDNPLALAQERIQKAVKDGLQKVRQMHYEDWADEWQKSFIYLPGNRYIENLWYLTMYRAVSSYRGKYPPFLVDELWNWKRDVKAWPRCHFHWNMFSPNFPMFAAGRWNLLEAYLNWKQRSLAPAIEHAKKIYSLEGAFFTDHANVTDGKPFHGGDIMKYNLTPGPQQAMEFYQYWQYTQDRIFLKERALPFMRKVAEFYMNILEKDDKGIYHFPRSTPYEFHAPFQFKDCITDLAHIRWLLPALIDAEKSAGSVSELSARAEDVLQHMADFTSGGILSSWLMKTEDGRIVYASPFFRGEPYSESDSVYCTGYSTKDKKMMTHMEVGRDPESPYGVMCGVESVCAFPPTLVNSDASPERRDVTGKNTKEDIEIWEATRNALRTLRYLSKNTSFSSPSDTVLTWSGHNINVPAFARLGLANSLKKALATYIEKYQMYPMGLWCYWGWEKWKDSYHTQKGSDGSTIEFPNEPRILHSSSEPTGIFAVTVQEMLLNSSDGVIRVFPAYDEDAVFGLFAVGGFFVTSEQKDNKTLYIRVESRHGNTCVLSSPWTVDGIEVVDEASQDKIKYEQVMDRISFSTQKGHSYIIKPKTHEIKSWTLTDTPRQGPRTFGKNRLGKPRDF